MKSSNSWRRTVACVESSPAAESTWVAAAPVSLAAWFTDDMLLVTSLVPVAASWTLRAISWVAADCSSTAAAIAEEMPLISLMVAPRCGRSRMVFRAN
jgi:hypothetical protein